MENAESLRMSESTLSLRLEVLQPIFLGRFTLKISPDI
jgi:hypothetical protein